VDTGNQVCATNTSGQINVFASATFSYPGVPQHRPSFETPTGLNVTGNPAGSATITQSVTFEAIRSTTAGPPRYTAMVIVSPKDYGITPLGHHQAGQGHLRRHPDARLTRVGSVRSAVDLLAMVSYSPLSIGSIAFHAVCLWRGSAQELRLQKPGL